MSVKATTKLVREGDFVAEISIELNEDGGAWAPHMSVADAHKLDDVRSALRVGNIRRASLIADNVYRLTPLGVADSE